LQQQWLSNEQAWLRFQQEGPKSKQGGLSPPGPPLTLTTARLRLTENQNGIESRNGNKTTFVATRRVFWALSASEMHLWSGLRPEPRPVSLVTAFPKTPSWWEGDRCLLPKNTSPVLGRISAQQCVWLKTGIVSKDRIVFFQAISEKNQNVP